MMILLNISVLTNLIWPNLLNQWEVAWAWRREMFRCCCCWQFSSIQSGRHATSIPSFQRNSVNLQGISPNFFCQSNYGIFKELLKSGNSFSYFFIAKKAIFLEKRYRRPSNFLVLIIFTYLVFAFSLDKFFGC